MKITIENEIERARHAGVNHPENYPFLLTPTTPNRHGVLLVHGFSATPREMRALAEHLVEHNFTVFGVRLPGHGTRPEDLAECRAEEWLAATEQGYRLLLQKGLTVNAVGLSTGALLVLKLALLRRVERLVLLSPYLRLKHPLTPLAGLLSRFIPYQQRNIAVADRPFYYQQRPLKGIAQINRLRRQVKEQLPQITTPTLVLTAKGDKTITPGTARQLFERLASPIKEYHCYGDSVPHVLTTRENPCRKDVFNRTLNFLSIPEQ